MSVPKVNTVVWLYPHQADALRRMARQNADAERAWLAERRAAAGVPSSAPTPPEIRLEALALRPSLWPGEGHLAEAAMRRRLASPDLAGPWPAFTESEREMQRLSGRRVGTPNQKFRRKMALDIGAEVIDAAQLAAHRVSEPIIAQLRAERLIGSRPKRSREAMQRKRELQEQIFTVGRIAREAIASIVGP